MTSHMDLMFVVQLEIYLLGYVVNYVVNYVVVLFIFLMLLFLHYLVDCEGIVFLLLMQFR